MGNYLRATASYQDPDQDPESTVNNKTASDISTATVTVQAAVIPDKPVGLTATAADSQVTLEWDDPDNDSVTGYEYQQKDGSADFGEWTTITDSAPGGAHATSYAVTGLTNGTQYRFNIRAVTAAGPGDATDAVAASPRVAGVGEVYIESAPVCCPRDTYGPNEWISVTVDFNGDVTIIGIPQVTLKIGDVDRKASYDADRTVVHTFGNQAYIFTEFLYEIQTGDQDTDGVSVLADALQLNGGTINSAAGNAVNLTIPTGQVITNNGYDKVDVSVSKFTRPYFIEPESRALRTVDENTASDQSIGAAVSAKDLQGDTLTYSISGDDARPFNVDTAAGQIKTKDPQDHEAKSSYVFTMSVHDAKDSYGGASTAIDETITVIIEVADVDEVPVAMDDVVAIQMGAAIDIRALGNDADPEGSDLKIISVAQPKIGLVVAHVDRVTYSAPADSTGTGTGTGTFAYTVTDGLLEATPTVTVYVYQRVVTSNTEAHAVEIVGPGLISKVQASRGDVSLTLEPTAPVQVLLDRNLGGCGTGPSGRTLTECVRVEFFDLRGGTLDTARRVRDPHSRRPNCSSLSPTPMALEFTGVKMRVSPGSRSRRVQ